MMLFCKEKEKKTMKPCFVKWLRAAGIRTIKAVVQTAVAAISTADGIIRSIGTNAPVSSPGAFLIPGADFAIMG